jgi:hypothetical protein
MNLRNPTEFDDMKVLFVLWADDCESSDRVPQQFKLGSRSMTE